MFYWNISFLLLINNTILKNCRIWRIVTFMKIFLFFMKQLSFSLKDIKALIYLVYYSIFKITGENYELTLTVVVPSYSHTIRWRSQ